MSYTVTKYITVKKASPLKGVWDALLLIVAIPVVLIALICLLLYFAFLRIKDLFATDKPAGDPYHLELTLLRNEHLTIILTEDEADLELTELNEAWMAEVYDEDTCLYRISTAPHVEGVHGSIGCFYLKEVEEGVLLQLLHPLPASRQGLNTRLVFLHFQTLTLSIVDETGPYFLYNDEKQQNTIRGFNRATSVVMQVEKVL